jgi:hypothetical protein
MRKQIRLLALQIVLLTLVYYIRIKVLKKNKTATNISHLSSMNIDQPPFDNNLELISENLNLSTSQFSILHKSFVSLWIKAERKNEAFPSCSVAGIYNYVSGQKRVASIRKRRN